MNKLVLAAILVPTLAFGSYYAARHWPSPDKLRNAIKHWDLSAERDAIRDLKKDATPILIEFVEHGKGNEAAFAFQGLSQVFNDYGDPAAREEIRKKFWDKDRDMAVSAMAAGMRLKSPGLADEIRAASQRLSPEDRQGIEDDLEGKHQGL